MTIWSNTIPYIQILPIICSSYWDDTQNWDDNTFWVDYPNWTITN